MSESLYQLVRDLRPPQLDSLGLVPALRALVSQDHRTQDLDVNVRVSGSSRQLDGLIDTAMFRVAQEALANVARHAHTGHADLDLQYEPDRVTLGIRDEGCGFDPAADFFPPRGWGLAGMRERVEGLGGHLELRSAPSLGTTVEAVIPLRVDRLEDLDHG
jgi:two-component system sensor histidine kinase DegS